MQEMKPIKEGKVREIYDNGDSLIMVATDRISCFDVILNNVVTKKGTVLTQMSKFWFEMTEDILPNHMTVSYTHLRAHETDSYLVCRLLLEKKKITIYY